MTSLAIAFSAAWLAVVWYLARLAGEQRRLADRLDALESQLGGSTDVMAKAA